MLFQSGVRAMWNLCVQRFVTLVTSSIQTLAFFELMLGNTSLTLIDVGLSYVRTFVSREFILKNSEEIIEVGKGKAVIKFSTKSGSKTPKVSFMIPQPTASCLRVSFQLLP
ncbi:hypothetical protein Fot_22371 [Forsythia ovata]|uniref:Uncharacterized protein n=1 Tax=Forsythia ovata TaxID=205694 RepID=A0ABD1UXI7_9LAMI